MTKKDLIDFMSDYPDDAQVEIDVRNTTLYEEIYDFTFKGVSCTQTFPNGTQKEFHILRLRALND